MDERLRELSEEFSANSESRLRQVARQHSLKPSRAELKAALAPRAHANELFAPPPRSLGKSAAERPGSRLQADLIDFSKNGTDPTHKYGLLVSDVYSRMAYTKPLETKGSEEVTEALNEIVGDIPGTAGRKVMLTPDAGGEFSQVDSVKGLIHRVKGEGDRNAIAVVDRTMQTIKKDLAGEVAIKGGTWSDHLAHVTKAFDNRYQPAVHGPPAKLVDNPVNSVQNFLVLQDNAEKFAHNDRLTRRRKADLERLGGFRDPISNGQRSFKASYGPVHEVDSVLPGNLKVRATDGNESLLKLVKAVPKSSAEPVASMTRQADPVKRKAPSAGSGKPMGKIPTAAGTPLEEGRKKGASSSSSTKAPVVPIAPVVPPASASSKPPASKADRFEGLRLMQGYLGPKRSPEELAAAKAKAAENKRQKEAEDARKAGEKALKAREKAELEAKEKAEKEQRKTQLKQLRSERLADDKARLKARKG